MSDSIGGEGAFAHLRILSAELGLTRKAGKTFDCAPGRGRWPSGKAMVHAWDMFRELMVRSRLMLSVSAVVGSGESVPAWVDGMFPFRELVCVVRGDQELRIGAVGGCDHQAA